MSDRLDKIRERWERDLEHATIEDRGALGWVASIHRLESDVAWLVAEVARLRALLAEPSEEEAERLGREVRLAWVSWAHEQPAPKPSWLLPWEALTEPDREVDRRIARAILADLRERAGGERE